MVRAKVWEELGPSLADVDVVLTTTGAVEPVITPDLVREAVKKRRGRPLFLLDIAVPRDVHPDVADVDGVFVFGLDDLDEIVQGNLAARRKEVPRCVRIVNEELEEFAGWVHDLDLRPTVDEFRAYLEGLKDKQVGYVRKKRNDDVAAEVERSLQQFIKKVLGRSMAGLKNSTDEEERLRHLSTLKRLFAEGERDRA